MRVRLISQLVSGEAMGAEASKSRSGVRIAGQIISGLIGGFLVLVSLICLVGAAVQGPFGMGIMGAFYLVGGLILIPPVANQLRKRLPGTKPIFVPPLLSLGLLMIGMVVGPLTMIGQLPAGVPQPAGLSGAQKAGADEREPTSKAGQAPPEVEQSGEPRSQTIRPPDPSPRAEQEIQSMWSEMKRVTQPCDQAALRVSDGLSASNRSDLVAAYDTAESARRICSDAWLAVSGIERPRSLSRESRRAFDKALDDCALAYLSKATMFGEMTKVINGDRRPSQVSLVQGLARTAQTQVVTCVLTLTALAQAEDIDLDSAEQPRG